MGYVLAINPGSTSTKVGVFEGTRILVNKTIRHSQEELVLFPSIISQRDFRCKAVRAALESSEISLSDISGVIGIGGLIRPGDAGVYRVNQEMLEDLKEARYQEHAANLGAVIAQDLAGQAGLAAAYVADPVTADELQPVARLSGMPEIIRLGRSHTLNQKSVAATAARDLGLAYEESHLVVAHLGGGISVTAHRDGRMVDTNSARGEGPFCIDRTGGINAYLLAKLCYSGRYTQAEMLKKINGEGGIVAYLGTRDFREVLERRASGEALAAEVFDAMAYQIAKEIAAMTVPLLGRVDAIVLTGGMANSKELTDVITQQVSYLGRVLLYPGELELEALAGYMQRLAQGSLKPMEYVREDCL